MKTLIAIVIIILLTGQTTSAEPQNQINSFDVFCVVNGVQIEWTMTGEVGIAQYRLIKDSVGIATVLSECPGCNNWAEYRYFYETYNPFGLYTLIPDLNSAIFLLEDCDVPVAVKLTSFVAQ